MKSLWRRLVAFGFRLLYNELAWTYDVVSWVVSLGEWRRWQRAALPNVHGHSILELGHGPGHMLLALAQQGLRPVGLDLSPQMGRLAQRRLARTGMQPALARGKSQALPFANGRFDTVLATFPTDYIVAPATLREIHRVLAENGRLVVVPEGHLTGQSWLHRAIDWAFRITGQRDGAFAVDAAGDWPQPALWAQLMPRFTDAGLALRVETVRLGRSRATVLIAARMPAAESAAV